MQKIFKILNGFDKLLRFFVFVIIIVMTCSTALQVIGRYILTIPFPWTEELSRRMMTWLLFIASAIAYRSGGMMGIDILTRKFSNKANLYIGVMINVMVSLFGSFLAWQGYIFASRSYRQISSALGISMMYVYMVIPFSGFLFVLFSIEHIMKRLSGARSEEAVQ